MEDLKMHERSYKCRRLETDLIELDKDIERNRAWSENPSTRLSFRIIGKYFFNPINNLTRNIISLRLRMAKADDGLEKERYEREY